MRRNIPRIDSPRHELVLAQHDEIVVCDSSAQVIWKASIPGLLDFAVTEREVVAVAQHRIVRFSRRKGDVLQNVECDYIDPAGYLLASATTPLLVWHGTEVRLVQPEATPVLASPPVSGELVFPLSPNRWITWHAGNLRLWRSIGDSWRVRVGDPGIRAVDAQFVLQGRLFALVQKAANELRLTVASMNDGAAQTSMRFAEASDLRFATTRGFAVARAGQVLTVIDLRFGRVVRELFLPDEVTDFAIDAAMQRVALISPQGIAMVGADSLTESAARVRNSESEIAEPEPLVAPPVTESEPEPAEEAEVLAPDASAIVSELPNEPLFRLDPIAAAQLADSAEAARDLALLMRAVGARIGFAIAQAWDSGRIARQPEDRQLFEIEVGGLLQLQNKLAEAPLAAAKTRLESISRTRAMAVTERGRRLTPLDLLRRDFKLSESAEVLLSIIAAPNMRGEFARLLNILCNDMGRATVDEHLLTQVFGTHNAALVARELDADMPLRKYGLIRVGTADRPFAALTVDPLIIRYITGQPLDGEVDPHLVVRKSDRDIEELHLPKPLLVRALTELASTATTPARIVVRGRAGVGRHTFLAALASRAGRSLGVIDVATMTKGLAMADQLKGALRRALLRGLVPCIDGLESAVSVEDPDTKLRVTTVLREHPGPLAIRLWPEAQIPLDPGYLLYEIPNRNEVQRGESWRVSLDRYAVPLPDASDLASRYRVGPGVIERVTREVAQRPNRPETPAAWVSALDEAVRQHLENKLGTTANRITRLASWADIVLPDDIMDSLLELTARVRHRKKVYETWGFDRSITTARGITALFAGTPGTGKTMVAGVIARDLGLDLYRVDVSRITSKWIGETEKNLGSLFDAAEDGQVMLLFDEADSLFAKRTEVKTSVDRYANMEVNYLLQRLDSFEGIAILTTNFGNAIDPAFKRRLTYRVTFPFPDEDMREKLWRALLPASAPTSGPLDFASLANRFRLSGGYIRNAVLRAAFLAAEEGGAITQEHLERAIRMEFREIGKLADSGTLE
ncbi:MAG TPA: ATP-binding protein [Kofleriaceae bacterium]|nr:ATP-binding protein [Kofleriaceae bacterium]